MKFWKKRKFDTNPRSRIHRGDPVWMMNLVVLLRLLNAAMISIIIVALALLWAVNQ